MLRNLLFLLASTSAPLAAQLAPGCSTVVAAQGVSTFTEVRVGPVRLAVPEEWLTRELAGCPAAIYTLPNQLDSIRALPVEGEWNPQYAAVIQAVFPDDSIAAHLGSEEWPGGRKFSDLQIRVYESAQSATALLETVRSSGLAAAQSIGSMLDGEVRFETSTIGSWSGVSLYMPVHFYDYGGTATVRVFVAECATRTATIVFMHESAWTRFDHSDLIRDILQRSSCGSQPN